MKLENMLTLFINCINLKSDKKSFVCLGYFRFKFLNVFYIHFIRLKLYFWTLRPLLAKYWDKWV